MLLFCMERRQFVYLFKMPLMCGGILGKYSWKETADRSQICQWDYISHLAWEYLGIPQEELEDVSGEKGCLAFSAQFAATATRTQIRRKIWKNAVVVWVICLCLSGIFIYFLTWCGWRNPHKVQAEWQFILRQLFLLPPHFFFFFTSTQKLSRDAGMM